MAASRFDAFKLLRKLHNKRLAFVGDSLNRNQWVSMVCLIDTATPTLHKYMSGNGSLVSFKISVHIWLLVKSDYIICQLYIGDIKNLRSRMH